MRRLAGLAALAVAACAPPDGTIGEQQWAVPVEVGLQSESRARLVDGRVIVSDVDGIEIHDAAGALVWKRTDLTRLEAFLPRGDKTLASGWTQEPTPTSWIVRLDAAGAETWRIEHPGLLLEQHVDARPDDGFVLAADAYEGATLADGTTVADWFVAAFDVDGALVWLAPQSGSVDDLRTTDDGGVVFLRTTTSGAAELVGLAADGTETWARGVPRGAKLGQDRLGRWIVLGCGELAVVEADGALAWETRFAATTCFEVGASAASDAAGRIALPEGPSLALRDAAGQIVWRTVPLGDETFSIAQVVPTGDDGWLALMWITPNLGYAVAAQTRLVRVDRDGAVSDPEIFRGGSLHTLLVDGTALRIFAFLSGTMSYGPGELTGQGAFVLGRTL